LVSIQSEPFLMTHTATTASYALSLHDALPICLDVTEAGWIGSSAFATYCAGIVLAFFCNGRLSPRAITLLAGLAATAGLGIVVLDRKSTRLNSSHVKISYAVFCLKKKRKDGGR